MSITLILPRQLGRDDIAVGAGTFQYPNPITGLPSTGTKLNAGNITLADGSSSIENCLGPWTVPTGFSHTALSAYFGTAPVTLAPKMGTWNITSNLTVPSNVTLVAVDGCSFNVSPGVTLTINGPFISDPSLKFTGGGTVVLGPRVSLVYPEWWYSNNWATAIQTAINSTSAGTVQVATTGTLSLDSTITAKTNVMLSLPYGTILSPSTDSVVYDMVMGSALRGGMIDVGAVAGYSASAIRCTGASYTGAAMTSIADIRLRGNPTITPGVATGNAIECHGDNDGVTVVDIRNFVIAYFERGIYVHTTGTGFCSDIMASNGRLNNPDYGIWCTGGGCQFLNVEYQAAANSVRGVYLGGGYNKFSGMIWDWSTGCVDPGNGIYGIEVTGVRNSVDSGMAAQWVLDQGHYTAILNSPGQLASPLTYGVIPPTGYQWSSYLGNQDDFLAFAGELGTYSALTGNNDTGTLSDMFHLVPTQECRWNAATIAAAFSGYVQIDFSSGIDFSHFGVIMKNEAGSPQNLRIKVYSSSDASWHTIRTWTTALTPMFYIPRTALPTGVPGNVTKIRVEFDTVQTGFTYVALTRLFAFGIKGAGTAYVQRGGDIVGGRLVASAFTKAGAIGDADFTALGIAAADGQWGIDITNDRLYFRSGGGWFYINHA